MTKVITASVTLVYSVARDLGSGNPKLKYALKATKMALLSTMKEVLIRK